MFENIVEELEVLKKELTRMMWHDNISKFVDDIQYKPVWQVFRMVGTVNKNWDRVRAFNVGDSQQQVNIEIFKTKNDELDRAKEEINRF